jgi:hypothetical protein
MEKKDKFREVMDRVWPRTKKELEKAGENAKKLLNKGEAYLRDVSERGVEQTKKLSLSIKKEKLYYDLGKTAANSPVSKWPKNKKISLLVKTIKKLDTQIKQIR